MSRALATIALLILSNTFMTLAWYGHIAFKSKIERFGMLSIILLSWGIALFEYCFQSRPTASAAPNWEAPSRSGSSK